MLEKRFEPAGPVVFGDKGPRHVPSQIVKISWNEICQITVLGIAPAMKVKTSSLSAVVSVAGKIQSESLAQRGNGDSAVHE
jgi:hypothetical protein